MFGLNVVPHAYQVTAELEEAVPDAFRRVREVSEQRG